jgi:hypothetical protein
MAVTIETQGRGAMTIAFTGVASTDAGAVGAVANPEGASLMLTKSTFYFATPATGSSAALSVGVGATATTSATDVLNALRVDNVSAGSVYNGHVRQNTAKTNMSTSGPAVWTSGAYITFTMGTASGVGLTGKLYLEYYRA